MLVSARRATGAPPRKDLPLNTPLISPDQTWAIWAVLLGVFVTAFYSFRSIFMTFHGKNRADEHTRKGLKESPGVVVWPLVLCYFCQNVRA